MTLFGTVAVAMIGAAAGAQQVSEVQLDAAEGREILSRFVETNRYWLIAPPPQVRQFSYTFTRTSGAQEFAIANPQGASRARRQGITYSSLLQYIVARPQSVTVRTLTRSDQQIRLTLAFDPPVRGACGNGIENSWTGYFNLGGDAGFLVLDARTLVPVEAGLGTLTESFGNFVAIDETHSVPLSITIQKDEMRFDWRFRVYEPGLWLFDDSHYGAQRVAWIEDVMVNEDAPVLRQAVAASLERQATETQGAESIRTFLDANRHWLLPSLAARQGLSYEYRQEFPYLERVLFDPDGNVMVQLVASKEAPDFPTRQKLWLSDGRVISGDARDVFAVAVPAAGPAQDRTSREPATVDRTVQNLAMALGWDCALTRIAREPEAFWFEKIPAETAGQYRLIAHARKDARLFAGTMLAFTSWAYMHDIRFARSEIVCDAATHRPLVERDFDAGGVLKGEFTFGDWIEGGSGFAPATIRAVIPHEKDGVDRSLEMAARFRFVWRDLWLLEKVESAFRGGNGSTGSVSLVTAHPGVFQSMTELRQKVVRTERVLEALAGAPEGRATGLTLTDDWSPVVLKARWTERALKSAESDIRGTPPDPLIGVYRGKVRAVDGLRDLELEGLSAASWKEFATEWRVGWQDAAGEPFGAIVTTNIAVRAENSPSSFVVRLPVPTNRSGDPGARLFVEGTVERMTGAYHGHGAWFTFMDED